MTLTRPSKEAENFITLWRIFFSTNDLHSFTNHNI